MGLLNLINEDIILPVSDLFLHRNIAKNLAFLQKSRWYSKSQLEAYQNQRFELLINYIYKNVPYYTDLLNTLNLKPSDLRSKNDLNKLPILSKSTIKKEGTDRFTSLSIPRNEIIKSSSSGSTGEPLFYYNTKEAYSMNIAANLRGWYGMGYRLGDRYIKLSQNPRKDPIKRLQDRVENNLYLAVNPLIDTNFEFILKNIERYKPKIIRCYPDPLLFLARYKQKHPEFIYKPVAIGTTGNTLYPETRKEIEEAFGCKIFDAYSCEGNSTVFECPTHSCYHSTEEYGISEVLDVNGNQITKGIGRLITTDLWNRAHPFIRYDTQDAVEIDDEPCKCGRQHLKIIRILGRDNEILEMETGRKFIVHNFTGFFQTDIKELRKSIDQFQVVKQDKLVVFRLVVNLQFDQNVSLFIRKHWEKEMQCKIVVEIVNAIPLSKSGKRRFIINE
jgi:phenylacetate-CoA ligase